MVKKESRKQATKGPSARSTRSKAATTLSRAEVAAPAEARRGSEPVTREITNSCRLEAARIRNFTRTRREAELTIESTKCDGTCDCLLSVIVAGLDDAGKSFTKEFSIDRLEPFPSGPHKVEVPAWGDLLIVCGAAQKGVGNCTVKYTFRWM